MIRHYFKVGRFCNYANLQVCKSEHSLAGLNSQEVVSNVSPGLLTECMITAGPYWVTRHNADVRGVHCTNPDSSLGFFAHVPSFISRWSGHRKLLSAINHVERSLTGLLVGSEAILTASHLLGDRGRFGLMLCCSIRCDEGATGQKSCLRQLRRYPFILTPPHRFQAQPPWPPE